MKPEYEQLKDIISASKDLVFFGGAGVSTESGIPDFRSVDGLYNQTYDYPPEEMLSHHFFERHPEEFYRFYFDKVVASHAKPNPAHAALAQLEQEGPLKAVVTQNIDGLHQAAGSRVVDELHGSIHRNFCSQCHRSYSLAQVTSMRPIPTCDCGGIIKPNVVLYEEPLDENVMGAAISHIAAADTLIIGGTSMVVYPAAGLVQYFGGQNLVVINREPSPADALADLVIHDPIGEVFEKLYGDRGAS